MIFRYPKSVRLRTRRQFQRMAHQSVRHVGDWVIIEARPNRESLTRLGITVTKRYGKSVLRNRFKRVVREAFRLCRQQIQSGMDLNVKPRHAAHGVQMQDVMRELVRFLR